MKCAEDSQLEGSDVTSRLSALSLALFALARQQVLGFEVEHVTITLTLASVAIARSLRLLCNLAHLAERLKTKTTHSKIHYYIIS